MIHDYEREGEVSKLLLESIINATDSADRTAALSNYAKWMTICASLNDPAFMGLFGIVWEEESVH